MDFLRPLREGIDLDDFRRRLADAPRRALLLDYDGTLAPFRPERDRAFPYDGLRETLARLVDGPTRLAIVTGRAVADALPLLGMEDPPEIWGTHGWERKPRGEATRPARPLPAAAARGLDEARAWAEARGLAERFERKPAAAAIHWRGLAPEEAARLRDDAARDWREPAERAGLEIAPFDGGLELRVPGRTKGSVVEDILAEEGDGCVVAYLGDDLTDEDAFRALAPLGPRALRVLVRSEPRPTEADAWTRPPEGVFRFLDAWGATAR